MSFFEDLLRVLSPLCPTTLKGRISRPLVRDFYFDCGTCGPAGAAGAAGAAGGEPPCNWLSKPPPLPPPSGVGAPGAVGALWPPSRIEVGLRFIPAKIDSRRLVTKNRPARIAVARVRTLAVPRLVMKPPDEPMPSPPPSERCNSTTPISDEDEHEVDDDDYLLHQAKFRSNRAGPGTLAPAASPAYIGIRRGLYTITDRFSTLRAAAGKPPQYPENPPLSGLPHPPRRRSRRGSSKALWRWLV